MTSIKGWNTHTESSYTHKILTQAWRHKDTLTTDRHVNTYKYRHSNTQNDGQGPSWSLTTDSLCRLTHQSSPVTGLKSLRPIIYYLTWYYLTVLQLLMYCKDMYKVWMCNCAVKILSDKVYYEGIRHESFFAECSWRRSETLWWEWWRMRSDMNHMCWSF